MTRISEFKKVRNAGCCNIEYGDQLTGVESRDKKEVVVHNASCENAKYALNTKFPIRWVSESDKEVKLTLLLKDRFGVLNDILNIISKYNLSVSKLNTKILKDGNVNMDLNLLDGPYIEKIVETLKELESVEFVKVSRGLFW